jgi:hypothetical protein
VKIHATVLGRTFRWQVRVGVRVQDLQVASHSCNSFISRQDLQVASQSCMHTVSGSQSAGIKESECRPKSLYSAFTVYSIYVDLEIYCIPPFPSPKS